ncbi:hypothetical protein ABZ725_50155 [Streptomyces sp. NPDC006872]|uniref:hypothetical protein n=1 Tax=Streptomyces sp. NPDC006872 TaxID=3155720 RepID=UPI0033EB7605
MTQRIDLLAQLMPPHPGAGDTVVWDSVERSWGTRFPGDYKEFITRYGAGAISDYLVLIPPESRAEEGAEPTFQGMEEETLNALEFWRAKAPGEADRDRVIVSGPPVQVHICSFNELLVSLSRQARVSVMLIPVMPAACAGPPVRAAMVSWLEEIERREAAARAEISELCSWLEELAGRVAEREAGLSRLEITRDTMPEILSGEVTVPVDEAEGKLHRTRVDTVAVSSSRAPQAIADAFAPRPALARIRRRKPPVTAAVGRVEGCRPRPCRTFVRCCVFELVLHSALELPPDTAVPSTIHTLSTPVVT